MDVGGACTALIRTQSIIRLLPPRSILAAQEFTAKIHQPRCAAGPGDEGSSAQAARAEPCSPGHRRGLLPRAGAWASGMETLREHAVPGLCRSEIKVK